MNRPARWVTRPEGHSDAETVRDINLAAFETAEEADLVASLRIDDSWIPGLSIITETLAGKPVGYALLTRCHIGDVPAVGLGPCAVLPEYQCTGAGSAAIRHALDSARRLSEKYAVVLGHAEYYPRFGFLPASKFGIGLPIEVPDEAFMALALDESAELPEGIVRYASPFGV
ncbi:N-acetyltransferase [Saccharomonospora sp. NPDC006951]